MSTRALALSSAVSIALVVLVASLSELSLERAALLAPAIVFFVGAVAGLAVVWGKAGADSLRRSRRPRLVVALFAAAIALLALLTWLGVELPREGA